jgi:hypothetical protein
VRYGYTSGAPPLSLLVGGRVLVGPGMLVRRSDVGSLVRRPSDLAAETEQCEEEEPNPVWAFTQLRRLGLGFMAVSHANLVGLIRVPRPPAHRPNGSGERLLSRSPSALPWYPDHREGELPRRMGIAFSANYLRRRTLSEVPLWPISSTS